MRENFTTREFMAINGAMITHDTILPGRMVKCSRTVKDIVLDVCAEYGLTLDEITSDMRCMAVSIPRCEAYLRCREAKFSTERIGMFFGRDHSTVITGSRVAKKRRAGI